MTSPCTAFDRASLYAKSRLFIRRALDAKSSRDFSSFHLWCSLALELLGKAALSQVSPALVADPTYRESLFAACGRTVGTDFKSITAKTVFERMPLLTKRFDAYTTKFCEQMALRRNSELHSGEAPLSDIRLDAWEPKFWHAAEVILSAQSESLEEWLGADAADAPKALLAHARQAIQSAVASRIELHRTEFLAKHKSKRQQDAARANRDALTSEGLSKWRKFGLAHIAATTCPACGAVAGLACELWSEEVTDFYDPTSPYLEEVERTYLPEWLYCGCCGLEFFSRSELEAANLDTEIVEREARERVDEPEYGND